MGATNDRRYDSVGDRHIPHRSTARSGEARNQFLLGAANIASSNDLEAARKIIAPRTAAGGARRTGVASMGGFLRTASSSRI